MIKMTKSHDNDDNEMGRFSNRVEHNKASTASKYVDLWIIDTVKPVCNDHLYDKIFYLWLIQ